MIQIELLEQSGYFKKRVLSQGEVLFGEGEIDENIYIIQSGEMLVEKSLLGNKNQYKVLAILKTGDIFGEGALNNSESKQVKMSALQNTTLLYINAQEGISGFVSHDIQQGIEFFKAIIATGNNRILKSNHQITASYEMNQNIAHLEKINIKAICELIEKFKNISLCDRILFIEKNPVLEDYYTLKYDTESIGKLGNTIITFSDQNEIKKQLKQEKIHFDIPYILIEKLSVGHGEIGYLILGRKSFPFEENDYKIISSMSTSLAGVMQQEKVIEEENNKNFIKKED